MWMVLCRERWEGRMDRLDHHLNNVQEGQRDA